MSSIKEQGDFWTLIHHDTQSGIFLTRFSSFVVVRSLTSDGNLLQTTGSVNRTTSDVTFSRICIHL